MASLGEEGNAKTGEVFPPIGDPIIRHESSLALARLLYRDAANLEALLALPEFSQSLEAGLYRTLSLRKLITIFEVEIPQDVLLGLLSGGMQQGSWAQQTATARLIYDLKIDSGFGLVASALRAIEAPVAGAGSRLKYDALCRRAVAAALRLGTPDAIDLVVQHVLDAKFSPEHRLIALQLIRQAADSPNLDPVLGNYWPIKVDKSILRDSLAKDLPRLLRLDENLLGPMIELAVACELSDISEHLQAIVQSADLPEGLRATAFENLAKTSHNMQQLKQIALAGKPGPLWLAAFELAIQDGDESVPENFRLGMQAGDRNVQQAILRLGGKLTDEATADFYVEKLAELKQTKEFNELSLDLVVGSRQREESQIRTELNEFEKWLDQLEPKTRQYSLALHGGDVARGEQIFREKGSVSCLRCHQAGESGGLVGPQLAGIAAKQNREYLLESIVEPNKQVAEGYESVVIWDLDGQQHAGIIGQRTERYIELLNAEGVSERLIPLDQIDEIEKGNSSMPDDLVDKLTLDELRDLVAYLASLTVPADNSAPGKSAADGHGGN